MNNLIEGKCSLIQRSLWEINSNGQIYSAQIDKTFSQDLPCVGDDVKARVDEYGKIYITEVGKRKNELFRFKDGKKQNIASNIDVVFVVSSMNNEFNIRKIERFAIIGKIPNSRLCFILTKKDLCENPEEFAIKVKNRFPNCEVVVTSALENDGLEAVLRLWNQGETAIFIGSSGVGKSTLINALAKKELMKTGEIRKVDDKGRHTTTTRSLFVIEGGRIVIDTPGVRSVGVSEEENSEGVENIFSEIIEIEQECRFNNCDHSEGAIGCAIRKAINEGVISEDFLSSYLKYKKKENSRRQKKEGDPGIPTWKKTQIAKQKKNNSVKRRRERRLG